MSTVHNLTLELIEMSRNCEVPIFDENLAAYLHDDNKPGQPRSEGNSISLVVWKPWCTWFSDEVELMELVTGQTKHWLFLNLWLTSLVWLNDLYIVIDISICRQSTYMSLPIHVAKESKMLPKSISWVISDTWYFEGHIFSAPLLSGLETSDRHHI